MLEIKEQIEKILENSKNILITFSPQYNGDSLGAAIALNQHLKSLGKNSEIVVENFRLKNQFSFLPFISEIKTKPSLANKLVLRIKTEQTPVESLSYDKKDHCLEIIVTAKQGRFTEKDIDIITDQLPYDLIFVLNTPDLESLKEFYENHTDFFLNTPIINLDHSPANEHFGQINWVDLKASSTSEVVFNLIQEKIKENPQQEKISEAILTGIIESTNSFKSPKITPRTLNQVAELIALGADREKIINNLYQIYSVDVLKLWGRALARLKENPEKGVVWSLITKEDFQKTNTNTKHLPDVLSKLIADLPKLKLAYLIYQNQNGQIKIILQNKGNLDLEKFFQEFPAEEKQDTYFKIPTNFHSLLEAEKVVQEKLNSLL